MMAQVARGKLQAEPANPCRAPGRIDPSIHQPRKEDLMTTRHGSLAGAELETALAETRKLIRK